MRYEVHVFYGSRTLQDFLNSISDFEIVGFTELQGNYTIIIKRFNLGGMEDE